MTFGEVWRDDFGHAVMFLCEEEPDPTAITRLSFAKVMLLDNGAFAGLRAALGIEPQPGSITSLPVAWFADAKRVED